jgi:hypothetical protein
MRDIPTAIMLTIALQLACILATGCSSSRIQAEIDRLPWRDQQPPADQPAQPDQPAPAVPDPQPPAAPATAEATQFTWRPAGNQVQVIVPAWAAHWQWSLTVTSPSVHHEHSLTPIQRGGGVRAEGGWLHTIEGSAESWRDASLALDPKGGGAVVFFLNLNARNPQTGWTAHHWVIPEPRQLTVIQEQ